MLRLSGSSDDLVCLEGVLEDEIEALDRIVRLVVGGTPDEATPAAGVVVDLEYGGAGCGAVWSARVMQVAEGAPIPWDVRFVVAAPVSTHATPYSVAVELDCPAGTVVRAWRRRRTSDPSDPASWSLHACWDADGRRLRAG